MHSRTSRHCRGSERLDASRRTIQIHYISSDFDRSFTDFASAEPVAINAFPVCPRYMEMWMTPPPKLDQSFIWTQMHWKMKCSPFKMTLGWNIENWQRMETSINSAIKNLTKECSTVFVHFSQDRDKNERNVVIKCSINTTLIVMLMLRPCDMNEKPKRLFLSLS